jgi:nitrogen fixation-related uncharacterized protein
MPDSLGPVLATLSYIAMAAVGLYVVYWAFSIRRRLIGRIYRDHALWLGTLGLVVAIPAVPFSTNNFLVNAFVAIYALSPWQALVVFAFIDSTVPVLRRSDPLLRNILMWRRSRIGLWCLLLSCYVLDTGLSIYGTERSYADIITAVSIFLVLIIGAFALWTGVRRSRDPVLRESVKWLGVALLFLLALAPIFVIENVILGFSVYYATYSYGVIPWNTVLCLVGYAFYRSARSLAPLNRLPPIEPAIAPSTNEAVR